MLQSVRWCWSFILNLIEGPNQGFPLAQLLLRRISRSGDANTHSDLRRVPTLFLICYIVFLYETERIKTNTRAMIV
jgi:hypothetical protein